MIGVNEHATTSEALTFSKHAAEQAGAQYRPHALQRSWDGMPGVNIAKPSP